jgi:hypothetical protein
VKTISIDGSEFQVDDKVEAYLKAEKARSDSAVAAVKEAKALAEEKVAEASKNAARADAAAAKLAESEKARADAADPAKIQAQVKARVELERQAGDILGTETKLDAMDDLSVRKAVVAHRFPEIKLDGKDAAYVNGLFDLAVAEAAKHNPSLEGLRVAAENAGPEGGQRKDALLPSEVARRRFIQDSESAYMRIRHDNE